jgi:ubiquinone/menaquinone biosynthesis C-methylase UbiE
LNNLISAFLSFFFGLLYNQFAWAYNWVAQTVSSGMWFQWVHTALPYLDQGPILDLGFGTGRLLDRLDNRGIIVVGLDKSMSMVKLAKISLLKKGISPTLVNGCAQNLPFRNYSFQRIASTFPSQFILERLTLSEIWRVLSPGGRLVIIPAAWITGKYFWDRLSARLFQITHQVPSKESELDNAFKEFYYSLQTVGFIIQTRIIELPRSKVICILAEKPHEFTQTRLGY